MRRWLLRISFVLCGAVAVASLLAFDYVRSFRYSVPAYDGVTSVTGLTAPVRIYRDRYAIPHIVAESLADAVFGQGYAHAQDRLWQMEMSRRYLQGRLSEMLGEVALGADIEMRTYGLYRAAEATLAHLAPQTQTLLQSYAAGVNAFMAEYSTRLPIEFALAGVTPEPWRPADSIAVLKGMAMTLAGNARAEVAQVRMLMLLGRDSTEQFLAPYGAVSLPAYLDEIYATTRLGGLTSIPDLSASNNWVVDGAHSVTGKPLLANDPHLGFTIPSTWYLAHLAFPGGDMVGGTLAGVPAIITGRNRHVAWGLTNTGSDTQDLYLERINPDNPRQYQTPAGWAEFETRPETIAIRFGDAHRMVVRSTRHGPVMNDNPDSAFEDGAPDGYALALAWPALRTDDKTMDAIVGIGRARDAAQFLAATRNITAPTQNIVYADDSGTTGRIGLVLPGRVPLRSARNDSHGLVPQPGWDVAYDWQGFIEPGAVPHIADPASGRIVTANNKSVPDGYPHVLSHSWDPPYRHDRIDALLAATSRHSIASFRAIQLDIVDTYALALTSHLIAAGPFAGEGEDIARLIAEWDGAMARESPEPLIFAAWARALAPRLFADELGAGFERYWGYRAEFTLRVLDNVAGAARWCDDRTSREVEDCPQRIRLALDDAIAELHAEHGADPAAWRWGDVHAAVHPGRPFGGFPLIGSWFNREHEVDGGPFTIRRADNSMDSGRPYAARHGSGYRGIYDLADIENSLYMISTGQSGNIHSPHYDDLMPVWAEGGYVAIPTKRSAIESSAVDLLTLQPDSAVKPL